MIDQGRFVRLHVYDLSGGLAAKMSKQLTGIMIEGIWHSSVVVYNSEWYWNGTIFEEEPGKTHYGNPVKIVDIGHTDIQKEVFLNFIEENRLLYTPETYDLFSHNCNNFSQQLVSFLTSLSIPSFILDLPSQFMSTSFGQMLVPILTNLNHQLSQRPIISTMLKDRAMDQPLVDAALDLVNQLKANQEEDSLKFNKERISPNQLDQTLIDREDILQESVD